MQLGRVFVAFCWLTLSAPGARADETTHRLTLREAIAHAVAKHPAISTAAGEHAAAEARVDVARYEATPRVELVGQVNRSTGNVVPGATFAMPGVPVVAGPPGTTRFGSGTWQSLAGVTARWDVVELVRRPTIVGAAEGDVITATSRRDVARLVVAAQTADAYLTVAEARALEKAARASEKRTTIFHDVVATLVGQKLRSDLDLARADTELAASRALVERARRGLSASTARLAETIGETSWSLEVSDREFADLPAMPAAESTPHPAIAAYNAAARAAERRAAVARLGYLPKVELVGAAWLRGGGYVLGGPNSGDASGLLPDTPNWAVGVLASWAPSEIGSAVARARAESADAVVQRSRAAEVSDSLSTEAKVARSTLESALAVARETRVAVKAARRAIELANTRYTTGNGIVVEVADAERALASAERDDVIARIDAWRALVATYRAQGNMEPLFGDLGKVKG